MNQESRIMNIKTKLKSIIHDSLFMIRKSKGFTMIELLIAISIIGILSSFLLANFVGVRQRARDGVRKSDLQQIRSVLEFYRADKGSYPSGNPFTSCGGQFTDGGSPAVVYMQKIPCDPSADTSYTYSVSGTGNTTYSISACLENTNDSQVDTAGTCTYTLRNP